MSYFLPAVYEMVYVDIATIPGLVNCAFFKQISLRGNVEKTYKPEGALFMKQVLRLSKSMHFRTRGYH